MMMLTMLTYSLKHTVIKGQPGIESEKHTLDPTIPQDLSRTVMRAMCDFVDKLLHWSPTKETRTVRNPNGLARRC